MTREEIKEVLMIVSTTFQNWKPNDLTATINVWSMLFKDYEASDIQQAVLNFIKNDTSGFAPTPGQIIANINTGREYLPEEDAWNLVYKGICNSNYHALEEFQKLPPECQKAIGSATMMREISMSNFTEMNVSKSYFLKAYKAEVEKRRNYDKTPEGLLEIKAERQAQIEVNKEGKLLIEEVKE